MKKSTKRNLILSALCRICALLLIGCGGSAAPAETAAPAAETAAPAESTAPTATLPDENLEPAGEPAPFDIAQDYIDRPLEELVAALGEPVSSEYGPSCLVQGAEDGMHQYEGFFISTLKEGDMETVKDVFKGSYK